MAACASAPSGPKVDVPAPAFEFEQLVGPPQLDYPDSDIEVQYSMRIGNRATVPMTLRRVQLRSVNPAGGAYSLVPRTYYFNAVIEPGHERTITFWARAISYGRGPREREPVTVRGVAGFDVPGGHYTHIFGGEMSQYGE